MASILLLFSSLTSGQELEQKKGVDPETANEFGEIDIVGLVNGSLNIHIPLLSLPQRGNLKLGFFASWNSKNWQMDYVPAGPVNVQGNWVYDLSTPPGVIIARDQTLLRLYDVSTNYSGVSKTGQTVTRSLSTAMVGTPDGGQHAVMQFGLGYSALYPTTPDGSGILGIPNGDPLHSNGLIGAFDRDGVQHI